MAFARNRTIIMVTHRGSLVDLADRIMVMDSGRVVADGPRDEIKQKLRGGAQAS